MRLRGERFWCESAAEVFHERADGTPGLSFRGQVSYPKRRAYLTMRNRLLTVFIHYRWRTLLVLLPVLLLYELASFVESARMGWIRQWGQAWSWQFRNLGILAARRRAARASRVLADRDVLTGGMPPLAPGLVNSRLERFSPNSLLGHRERLLADDSTLDWLGECARRGSPSAYAPCSAARNSPMAGRQSAGQRADVYHPSRRLSDDISERSPQAILTLCHQHIATRDANMI